MADKELTVQKDSLYMLRWTVPDTPVINKFVDPGGGDPQAFPDPKDGENPADVEITVKKGKDEASAKPDSFRKNRTPPLVAKTVVTTDKGQKRAAKVFSAVFKAREEGVYLFNVAVKAENKTITQKITVLPAKKRYRTIQEVIDDPKAVRRQAVLAGIADFFPAFNIGSGLKIGSDSGHLGQGPWIAEYAFPLDDNTTSCTTVNPLMMNDDHPAKNSEKRWSFNAGPEGDDKSNPKKKIKDPRPMSERGNKGWLFCNKDTLPSVGDTYIVLNKFKQAMYGHVGIVLEVPPSGNGLWVTADGGQGSKSNKQQLGIIVPRWGLMGAMLPPGGDPPGSYQELKPEDEAGPFLGAGGPGDVKPDVPKGSFPVPKRHDDIPGMVKKIVYKPSVGVAGVPNPRRMHGFVDVDSTKLTFDVDGKTNPAHIAKCKLLQAKVEKVIEEYLGGKTLNAKST